MGVSTEISISSPPGTLARGENRGSSSAAANVRFRYRFRQRQLPRSACPCIRTTPGPWCRLTKAAARRISDGLRTGWRDRFPLAGRTQMPEGRPRAGEQSILGLLIQAEGIRAKVAERSVADGMLEIAGKIAGGLVVQRLLKHLFTRQETRGYRAAGRSARTRKPWSQVRAARRGTAPGRGCLPHRLRWNRAVPASDAHPDRRETARSQKPGHSESGQS